MDPSQIKRLADLLRSLAESLHSDLSEIKDAAKDQERAIRDTAQARDTESGKIPGVIARVATAIESANADVHTYEKPQRNKEYRLQRWFLLASWITAVATLLAFAAAGIYAHIAKQQLDRMIEANENARCANLVNEQSTSETAYYSREEERAWVEPWLPTANSMQLSNYGKTVGRDVRVVIHAAEGEKQFGPFAISPYTYSPVPIYFPGSNSPGKHLSGEITYIDVFGVTHWTKFCYAFGERGRMEPCRSGNDEDHNLENPPKDTAPKDCKQ